MNHKVCLLGCICMFAIGVAVALTIVKKQTTSSTTTTTTTQTPQQKQTLGYARPMREEEQPGQQ